jgi:hypothetical protein
MQGSTCYNFPLLKFITRLSMKSEISQAQIFTLRLRQKIDSRLSIFWIKRSMQISTIVCWKIRSITRVTINNWISLDYVEHRQQFWKIEHQKLHLVGDQFLKSSKLNHYSTHLFTIKFNARRRPKELPGSMH